MHCYRFYLAAALVFCLVLVGAGCGGKPTKPMPTAPAEPEYAPEIAEGILKGIDSGDYAAFSQHFDEAMKASLTEAAFIQMRDGIKKNYGDYLTKEFSSTEKNVQGIYTVVMYRAKFSRGALTVKVVFRESEGGAVVSGLWFQ
ncbi:MAG: DUF3887 domain-containing protein [Dehalococcoidales bacterium]|nr:DUF3887 domain-containing protein [Dehalococcoidales bacterium]